MTTRFRLAEVLGDRMTQYELAQQAGVHYVTVNRLCNNTTSRVDLATLDKLASVLGCAPGDLIEQTPRSRKGTRR